MSDLMERHNITPIVGRSVDVEEFTFLRALWPELLNWAKAAKQRGEIVEFVLHDATSADVYEYDLDVDGKLYLNADRTAAVGSWERARPIPAFPVPELLGAP